ncbi:MAG: helicase, partial [Streptosporangiaceae bacterium]|nr:helicase [Streptosporangiaceae bacterium]
GADELQKEPGGGIQIVLTEEALYCANLGTPVSPEGVETILASHLSRKRGTEIGRFGLGFKSVLSVSDRPASFSRSGSFGWDATATREAIRARVASDTPTPVLRVAHLLDSAKEKRTIRFSAS